MGCLVICRLLVQFPPKLCERDWWAGAAPWKCRSIYHSVLRKLFMLGIFYESNVSTLLNMLKFKHNSENISINEAPGIEIYTGLVGYAHGFFCHCLLIYYQ